MTGECLLSNWAGCMSVGELTEVGPGLRHGPNVWLVRSQQVLAKRAIVVLLRVVRFAHARPNRALSCGRFAPAHLQVCRSFDACVLKDHADQAGHTHMQISLMVGPMSASPTCPAAYSLTH